MNKKEIIKLYVSCHKDFVTADNPLLKPIQVGTSLVNEKFPRMLHDNVGENISDKNKRYSELTAQYWAWINDKADFYGFFHYRRYLYPNTSASRPYCFRKTPNKKFLEQSHFSQFESLIPQYEIIVPKKENMWLSVEEHYSKSKFHHRKDLDLMKTILLRLHPQYQYAMEDYLSQNYHYFGNIFIMRQAVFFDYCDFLFSVLLAFEKECNFSNYGAEEMRVMGYLGERLLGIYYTRWKTKLRCLELPRVHFEANTVVRRKKQFLNFCLPAGSWSRAKLKEYVLK